MKLITFGPVRDDGSLPGKLATWLSRLPPQSRLALVYTPHNAAYGRILKQVTEALKDVVVVGATTGGVAFTERGVDPDGVVIGVMYGDDFEVAASVARNVSRNTKQTVTAAIEELVAAGPSTFSNLLVLCDGLAGGEAANGDLFMKHVAATAPLAWRAFGGRSGDHWKFNNSRLFWGTQDLRDAAIFVRFKTQGRMNVGAQHGWVFDEQARQLSVTEVEGTVVSKLDNKPAATVLTEELARLGLTKPGQDPSAVLPAHPLGLRTPFGEGIRLRAVISVNGNGTLALGGEVAAGDSLRFVKASTTELIGAAKTLSSRVREESTTRGANGSLVFDCAGRVFLLRDHYLAEANAFCTEDAAPVIGTSCYGEFGRFGISMDRFFNCTAVMATW